MRAHFLIAKPATIRASDIGSTTAVGADELLARHTALLPLHDLMPERLIADCADAANSLRTLARRELHFLQIRAIRVIHG